MLFCLFFAFQAAAQEMPFFGGQTLDKVSLSADHQDVSSVREERAALTVPLFSVGDDHFAFIARGQRMQLAEPPRFPVTPAVIPAEFGSADFGLAWGQEDSAGKISASGTYGSSGTQLFSGKNSAIVSANLFVERKKTDHSWIYFLAYSNNRTVLNNIPLPGIAYSVNEKTYTAVFGLPFVFLTWRPDPYTVSTILSPFGASLDTSWRFWGPLQAYANTNWSPKAYQNLVDGSDKRLIFDKKEAGAGLRYSFGPMASLSAGYVYGFGRRFLLADSLTEKDAEGVSLSDAPGWAVRARVSFSLD